MTKILIVEDEPIVAEVMAMVLADAGHQVVGIASDETTAIKHAASVHPELVLMDIKLANDGDGIETAKRMRARAPIPVVFVSAYLDSNTRRRAATVSPVGYLVKPYSPHELIQTVTAAERAVRRRH
jgi:CheY-like chemotaxis protein